MTKKREFSLRERLEEEAGYFDSQILERISNGHIPDLRRSTECNYFYNNTWRHPDYIKLDFIEQFEIIKAAIDQFCSPSGDPINIIEIGCGPGYISLELARNKYNVTGVDLSTVCINIAKRFADEDPWKTSRGGLEYICGDLLDGDLIGNNLYDVVVFVGALHHFPDQAAIMQQVLRILKKEGIVIAHEPTRDRMTMGNALVIQLVRVLLSQCSGFYAKSDIPETTVAIEKEAGKIFNNMRYEAVGGEKLQSVNDNEAGFKDMINALNGGFEELVFKERYAFFHELIGGLRFEQNQNRKLAKYLHDIDAELCKQRTLQSTEFFYVGRKKGES